MTIDEIESTFLCALKADTYARGSVSVTSIGMTCLTITRKLQADGIDNALIAQALTSLGNKKNWKLLTKMGENMLHIL